MLHHVPYLYLEHVNNALKNSVLYTEHTNWEKWSKYDLQGEKLPRMFESLPVSVAVVPGIMKLESRLELS